MLVPCRRARHSLSSIRRSRGQRNSFHCHNCYFPSVRHACLSYLSRSRYADGLFSILNSTPDSRGGPPPQGFFPLITGFSSRRRSGWLQRSDSVHNHVQGYASLVYQCPFRRVWNSAEKSRRGKKRSSKHETVRRGSQVLEQAQRWSFSQGYGMAVAQRNIKFSSCMNILKIRRPSGALI